MEADKQEGIIHWRDYPTCSSKLSLLSLFPHQFTQSNFIYTLMLIITCTIQMLMSFIAHLGNKFTLTQVQYAVQVGNYVHKLDDG